MPKSYTGDNEQPLSGSNVGKSAGKFTGISEDCLEPTRKAPKGGDNSPAPGYGGAKVTQREGGGPGGY